MTGLGPAVFLQQVWTVAKVVPAIGDQRLEALLLQAFDIYSLL